MDKVKVHKNELLEILKKNRNQHREIFDRAVEGYKDKAVEQLNDHIEQIRNGSLITVRVVLPRPEDHTNDYDRAIRMAEMSVDEEIELKNHDFQRYVMDDWEWAREFVGTASMYTEV